ncbi:hypothetical protein [Amycolatopsis taiwanensis]|uniref:Uncharacterized protein n=1 Tax=Amycolatopsis taiwanensis TaxID=342230 RepID=A0A9W6R0S0_9PSEU|nr:hypothetical protein [Amycolatopsis taiwanensis]GLY65537.1 hypothetical protein Atai01_21560 [Amycolatopsis taiwanensis]
MQIAGAIGSIAATSLAAVIAVVVLFGLGVLGISRYETARANGSRGLLNAVGAGAAFMVCLAIAVFGLYLIVVK